MEGDNRVMPFYIYKCTNPGCRKLEEHFQSIHHKPEIQCEVCKSISVRIISTSSFNFSNKPKEKTHSQRRKEWNDKTPG
jgi:putative FmdB family regulatory protein